MAFACKIIEDSINEDHWSRSRLTTFELTYPRFIHSEFMTHRLFSRNSASSRAIPVRKMLDDVINDPVIPIHWGANEKGMQANSVLGESQQAYCLSHWLEARDRAIEYVEDLQHIGLHKQIANRLLEPWMWITVIATSTERCLQNFFKLRCHEAAEPHMQKIAYMMRFAYGESSVTKLSYNAKPETWHIPFVSAEERNEHDPMDCIKKSVARCARGSYLQHNGNHTFVEDLELYQRLSGNGHWSPFEHQAWPQMPGIQTTQDLSGNFGTYSCWVQNRKTFTGETGAAS